MYWVSLQAVSGSPEKLESVEVVTDTTSKEKTDSDLSLDSVSTNNTNTLVPSQQVVPPKMPNTADQLMEVTLALALVVGLIYGIAWLIKRNKGLSPTAGIPMKTLSVLPMGVKEKIILIEVGGKQILLGMTPQQINTLATFDEPIVDSSLNNDKPFSSRLKEILNQNKTVEPKE